MECAGTARISASIDPINGSGALERESQLTYRRFRMVQLDTSSQAALGKQAKLRNEELVQLHIKKACQIRDSSEASG